MIHHLLLCIPALSHFNTEINYKNLLCKNDQAAILFAKCNYGVAILPEIYIPTHIKRIVALPFMDDQMTIEYGITYHKNLKEKYIKEFTNYFITNK